MRGLVLRWEVMKEVYQLLLNKQLSTPGPIEWANIASRATTSGKRIEGSKGLHVNTVTKAKGGNSKSIGVKKSGSGYTKPKNTHKGDLDPEILYAWKNFDDHKFDLRQMICDLLEEDNSYHSQGDILEEIVTRVNALAIDYQANVDGQEPFISARAQAMLERSPVSFEKLEEQTPEDPDSKITGDGPWYRLRSGPGRSVSTSAQEAFISTPKETPQLLDPISMDPVLTVSLVRSGAIQLEEEFITLRARSRAQLVSFHNSFGRRTPLPVAVKTWDDMLNSRLGLPFWTDYAFSGSSTGILFGDDAAGQNGGEGARMRQLLTRLNEWARAQDLSYRPKVSLLCSGVDGGTSNSDTWPTFKREYPHIDFYLTIVQKAFRCWNRAFFHVDEDANNCWATFDVDILADLHDGQHDAVDVDLPESRLLMAANLVQYHKEDISLRSTHKHSLHVEPFLSNRLAAQLTGGYRKAFGLSNKDKKCEVCHVEADEDTAPDVTWSRGRSTDVAVVCDKHVDDVSIERVAADFGWTQLPAVLTSPFVNALPFSCKQEDCASSYATNVELKAHKKSHETEGHGCPKCAKRCSTLELLKKHMQSHAEKHFKCTWQGCDAAYLTNHELGYHVRQQHTHIGMKWFECTHDDCVLQFDTTGALKEHLEVHDGTRPYACNVEGCGRGYKGPAALAAHAKAHWPFACTAAKCKKLFKDEESREEHLKSEHGPQSCEQCEKVFDDAPSLKAHLKKSHPEDKPHACTKCALRFKTIEPLKKHMDKIHPLQDGEWHAVHECGDCDETFQWEDELAEHRVMKHERLLQCSRCEKRFGTASSLKVHESGHDEKKPHACPKCDKSYSQHNSLREHMRTQHPVKDGEWQAVFPCEECDKSFEFLLELKHHMVEHEDPYKFPCLHPGCGMRFKMACRLKEHAVAHSDEKPYKCTICGAKFKLPRGVTRHIRLVHKKDSK